jgi:hypothetical protein
VPERYVFIGEGICRSVDGKPVNSNQVCHFYKEIKNEMDG